MEKDGVLPRTTGKVLQKAKTLSPCPYYCLDLHIILINKLRGNTKVNTVNKGCSCCYLDFPLLKAFG